MTQADVLTAIDDALETGRASEGDTAARELQELALLLRADAPQPSEAYRESLGRRVERGFPRRPRAKQPWWGPWLQPAAAVVFIGLLVLGIAALAGGGSGGDVSSGGGGGADSSGS